VVMVTYVVTTKAAVTLTAIVNSTIFVVIGTAKETDFSQEITAVSKDWKATSVLAEITAVMLITSVVTTKETVIMTTIVKTTIIVVKITVRDLDLTQQMTAVLKKKSVLAERAAVIVVTNVVTMKETVNPTAIVKTTIIVAKITVPDLDLTKKMTAVLNVVILTHVVKAKETVRTTELVKTTFVVVIITARDLHLRLMMTAV